MKEGIQCLSFSPRVTSQAPGLCNGPLGTAIGRRKCLVWPLMSFPGLGDAGDRLFGTK